MAPGSVIASDVSRLRISEEDGSSCRWYRRPDLEHEEFFHNADLSPTALCEECRAIPSRLADIFSRRPGTPESKGESRRNGFTFKKSYAKTQQDAATCALCRAVDDSIRLSQLYPGVNGPLLFDKESHVLLQPLCDGPLKGFYIKQAPGKGLGSDTQSDDSDLLSNDSSSESHSTSSLHSSNDTSGVVQTLDSSLGFLSIGCQHEGDLSTKAEYSRIFELEPPGCLPYHDMGQLLRGFLQECEGHKTCSQLVQDIFTGEEEASVFPARLLRIQQLDGDLQVRICESASDETREDYVALSHCWGDPELVIKTTTSCLEEFKIKVPRSKLSPTMLQAIEITHAAGLSYIWVDSLCIIQDDAADWARESPRMVRHATPI